MRLPPAAGPGDRVGVAALSGPVDPARLERGLDGLRALGFEPVLADNARSRAGFFAGDDASRLAAFHRLAARPDLAAILFTRGGHGLLRVLPGIDWDLLRRQPRAYVGYSDLTPFLLGVVQRLGLVAFHGPLVGGELANGLETAERESLLAALAGRYPAVVPFSSWVRPGTARGPLLGGCLSLLAATLGTPFFPDLAGAIVFWEEVNEAPYRVDRMLTHLGLSDRLNAIGGMVVGHVTPPAGAPAGTGVTGAAGERSELLALPSEQWPWPELIADGLSRFTWPLAYGLEAGHRSPNLTLPLGLPATLDAGAPAGSAAASSTVGGVGAAGTLVLGS